VPVSDDAHDEITPAGAYAATVDALPVVIVMGTPPERVVHVTQHVRDRVALSFYRLAVIGAITMGADW
jgi:hypothetical protein